MNVDGSDKRCTDGGDGEEAMFPVSDVQRSLVEIKQSLQPANNTRVHTVQLSWNTYNTIQSVISKALLYNLYRYGNSADNIVEENSSIFSLIRMR